MMFPHMVPAGLQAEARPRRLNVRGRVNNRLPDVRFPSGNVVRPNEWPGAPDAAARRAGPCSTTRRNGGLGALAAGAAVTLSPARRQATRGGQRTGDLLVEPERPMARFEGMIKGAIEDDVAALPAGPDHRLLPGTPARRDLNVWASVLPSRGYQVSHIHKPGWIGGCRFVPVSGAVSEPEEGHQGWIEFGRPQSICRATAEPEIRLVRPQEGLMVMFPSFSFHRTIQFDALAGHIRIAFHGRPADEHRR